MAANTIKQVKSKQSGKRTQGKEQMKETVTYRKLLNHIMNQIAAKSDFLIEERLKVLLETHLPEEKALVRVDNVCTALNIKNKTDIDLLMSVFLPYTYCSICTSDEHEVDATSESEMMKDESSSKVQEKASISTTQSYPGGTEIKQVMLAVQEPNDIIEDIVHNLVDENRGDLDFTPPTIVKPVGECAGPGTDQHKKDQEEEESAASDESPQENMVCEFQHPLVIRKIYVLKALKQFIAKYYVGQEGLLSMEYRLCRKRNTISRLMEDEDIKTFWVKFANIYTKEMEALWTGLFEGLRKYHDILKDRKVLSQEVWALRRENAELKKILELHVFRHSKPVKMGKDDSSSVTEN